jgi:uncharacterized protein (DUF362 family)
MTTQTTENTVIVKYCEEYNREKIASIISEGMACLNYTPRGNVFVKPNVVFAYNTGVLGNMSYTATPFVGASLLALSQCSSVKRIDMGENSAIQIPTRLCYKHAGYYDELKRVRRQAACPVNMFCIDEERRDSVFIGGTVHDTLRVSRKMARADSKVYLPKLKRHCVSNMTGVLKLNIGICSDDERSIRHDYMLNEKIVDLLKAGYPDFIAMDAIDVGVGNESFPSKRKLGLILMGTNPLAVDIIGARLLGFGIDDVPYLRAAVNRGYTPGSPDHITLGGDVKSLDEIDGLAKRLLPHDEQFDHWQDINNELTRLKSPLRFMWGPYSDESSERCSTGCTLGLKGLLCHAEKYHGPEVFAKADPAIIIVGKWKEPIDARGAQVFLIGSCTRADISNAKKITHINKCFTTAGTLNMIIGNKLGMKVRDYPCLLAIGRSSFKGYFMKLVKLRYLQDTIYRLRKIFPWK